MLCVHHIHTTVVAEPPEYMQLAAWAEQALACEEEPDTVEG